MTSIKSSTCGPCKFRDISETASVWCLVCKEGLCTGCKESHAGFKLFRSHAVINYENMKDMPEIAKNVKELCFDHDRKYEFYCSDHHEPCCIRCNTTNHKNCVSLCPIEDVIENVKSSVAIKHIDDSLISLISKTERVIEKKENSVLQIKEEAIAIKDTLEEVQTAVCEKLKRQCSKLDEVSTAYNTKTCDVIRKLKGNLNTLRETEVLIAMLKENGSNLQIVLCLKVLEAMVSKEEDKYTSMKEKGELDDAQIVFQPSIEIAKLMSLLDVGHIEMKMRPLNLPTNCSEQSAKGNDETKPISYNIDEVIFKTIDASFTHTVFNSVVISAVILSNDCMLFCDSKFKRLLMHDAKGVFLRNIEVESEPYGITATDDLIVAVTCPQLKSVKFIELSSYNDNVIKQFGTIGKCFGIEHENNQLVVSVEGIGIHIYDLDGNLLKTISLAGKAVIFHGFNICYLGKNSTFLRCCDYLGRIIWELQLPQECNSDPSIAKDTHGNMYIAGFDDLYIVQSDGSRYRKLTNRRTDKKDKTPRISGVHFNNRKKQLLCINQDRNALLYDVSFKHK